MREALLAHTELQHAAIRLLDHAWDAVNAHGTANDMFNNFDGDIEALRTLQKARADILTDIQQNCFA